MLWANTRNYRRLAKATRLRAGSSVLSRDSHGLCKSLLEGATLM
jgi:hypothetical protein